MRTYLIRAVLALAVMLAVSGPAAAQSVVRGKVLDAQGKPVEGAVVTIEATEANRKAQTKTNRNGEFLQVGLASGRYNVTVTKDNLKAGAAGERLAGHAGRADDPAHADERPDARAGQGSGGDAGARGGRGRGDARGTRRRCDPAVQRDRRQGADVQRLLLQPGRRLLQEAAVRPRPRPRSRRRSSSRRIPATRTPASPTSTTRRSGSTSRSRRARRPRNCRPRRAAAAAPRRPTTRA